MLVLNITCHVRKLNLLSFISLKYTYNKYTHKVAHILKYKYNKYTHKITHILKYKYNKYTYKIQ